MLRTTTNKVILLVDDDEDDQVLFRHQLSQHLTDCQVIALSNGQELLAYLDGAETLPELILLDVNMPIMNGFEALSQLRANPAYQSIYVVMITTAGRELERHKALFLGAHQFMVKPATQQEFSALMQRLVQSWTNRSQETEHFF